MVQVMVADVVVIPVDATAEITGPTGAGVANVAFGEVTGVFELLMETTS